MKARASSSVATSRGVAAVAVVALVAIAASYYYLDFRPTPTGAPVATVMVALPNDVGSNESLNFQPDSIVVVIGVNNTVTWTNEDTQHNHTVTATSGPTPTKSFNSGNMAQNASFTFTFIIPGTYEYVCAYHAWMHGTVTVKKS